MFQRAYRITYASFQELHDLRRSDLLLIHKELMVEDAEKRRQRTGKLPRTQRDRPAIQKQWKRFIPNGNIDTAGCTFGYCSSFFIGGNIDDTAPLYGIGRTDVFRSVWMVVEVIHPVQAMNIVFPVCHNQQRALAREFSK